MEMVLGKLEVEAFTNPKDALKYIDDQYTEQRTGKTILLLDINMPIMSGWEFLERFDSFGKKVKGCIDIYILSSSVDPRDKDRSYSNKNVKDYLLKPLSVDVIKEIMKV